VPDKALYHEIAFPLPERVTGDGFVLVQRARAALRRAGVSNHQCENFVKEALAGGVAHRVAVIKKWMTTTHA